MATTMLSDPRRRISTTSATRPPPPPHFPRRDKKLVHRLTAYTTTILQINLSKMSLTRSIGASLNTRAGDQVERGYGSPANSAAMSLVCS